jgi:hypothetical protein
MIELDIYFYVWLGTVVIPIVNIQATWPIQTVVSALTAARTALVSFGDGTDRARAFPRSAPLAMSLCAVIDQVTAPVQYGAFYANPAPPRLSQENAEIIQTLCRRLLEALQQESQHTYVLMVEDQRVLSAYILVEQIERAITPNTWRYLSTLARREVEECGKCLCFDRFTACGFHILRGVESVIKEYLVAAGRTLANQDRNWGAYVRLLREINAASEVASIVDNLRQDDRNTLMHPEKFLDVDQAIGLFFLCLTALDRLIADMKQRGFAKEFNPVTAPSA